MNKKFPIVATFLVITFFTMAQAKAVYSFPLEDSVLKHSIFSKAEAKQNALIAGLGKENKDDYKEVYENRFKMISSLLKSSRLVAEPDAHQYLQSVLDKIVSVNPELKPLAIRLVFSRDWWPNAYSMGEGTLVVNAGLLVRLKDESELAFVMCHELAHLYLDHSEKAIRKNISAVNSTEFKDEIKRLKKQEYGVNAELEKLLKKFAFSTRRHSRDNEAEADGQGMKFLRNTKFNSGGAISCLHMLDTVDDSTFYANVDLPSVFNFPDYYFKKRWIQNEAVIFGQMKGDNSGLTEKEKDSLRTHPDCPKRIATLEPIVASLKTGQHFLVDSVVFSQLKNRFEVELIEELYQEESYSFNLYFALGLLRSGEYRQYAIYSIARVLNSLYDAQAYHRLGLVTDKENRGSAPDYNLLCRMLDRLRLDEIADLNYYFCKQNQAEMAGYSAFQKEWESAQKNKEKSSH